MVNNDSLILHWIVPSGKHTNKLWTFNIFHGSIKYLDVHFQEQTVSLPEGNGQ